MQTISSRENPIIKNCVSLMRSRKERLSQSLFITEGHKISQDAHRAGCTIQSVLFTQDALEKHGAFIAALAAQGAQEYLIADSVAQKMADAQSTQGLFCVWQLAQAQDTDYFPLDNARIMVLCSLQDPGNVGAIIRSCEAMGLDALMLSADCPDLYSPKLLRAASGGIFRLPVYLSGDIPATVRRLQAQGVQVYAAALSETGIPPQAIPKTGAAAVLIGNEGAGLPEEIIAAAGACITIPMAGGAQSLNAACAATIIAWELYRSRASL